jgi:hypothetical protein
MMRAYLHVAAMVLVGLPVLAVDGVNLPGSDYAHFSADSQFVCRNSCGGDPDCKAWTWVKPGIQGPAGQCWLKSRVPPIVKDDCCSSGARENISARDLKAEDHTNRPGSDYRNFETDTWNACESSCSADQSCAAWSYARRGVQGPRGHCWLKRQVPRPVGDAGVISGVKYRSPAGRFD